MGGTRGCGCRRARRLRCVQDDDDAALAEEDEDTLREADVETDAEAGPAGEPRPPDVDAAAEEVSPAGD